MLLLDGGNAVGDGTGGASCLGHAGHAGISRQPFEAGIAARTMLRRLSSLAGVPAGVLAGVADLVVPRASGCTRALTGAVERR